MKPAVLVAEARTDANAFRAAAPSAPDVVARGVVCAGPRAEAVARALVGVAERGAAVVRRPARLVGGAEASAVAHALRNTSPTERALEIVRRARIGQSSHAVGGLYAVDRARARVAAVTPGTAVEIDGTRMNGERVGRRESAVRARAAHSNRRREDAGGNGP